MIELSIAEVVNALGARLTAGTASSACSSFPSVSIDSRTVQAGECFVAVKGKRFDGHDFVEEALKKGASAVILCRDVVDSSGWKDRFFLEVDETETALQTLGHYVRKKWGKSLLAISGSMGKTTTREFTATLLEKRFEVVQSPGNLNNEIGVPLSLLQISEKHQLALLELGMNHTGEMRALTRICAPDAALLTNVASVHSEFFADLDEIASAKGEILEGLPPKGKFFFNADDPRLCRLAFHYSGDKMSFSLDNPADVRILNHHFQNLQKMSFEIEGCGDSFSAAASFVGKHFLYDIAAAVAVAVSFGLSRDEICEGISRLKVPSMRGDIHQLKQGEEDPITVWDDSYNSNPYALTAVLETVGNLSGFRRKILALGAMLELGPLSPELHRQSGHCVAQCDVDWLVTVGKAGLYIGQGAEEKGFSRKKITHFESSEEAADFLVKQLAPGEFLLVKGSRGVHMDRIVQKIKGRSES